MSLRAMIAALLTTLLLTACGGSSHSSTSSTASSSSSPASTPTSTTARTPTSSTSPATLGSASETTSTTRPPEVPRKRARRRTFSPHPVAPARGVRIQATFTIGSGGAVTPMLISVPVGVAIEVQLRNRDGRPHTWRPGGAAGRLVTVGPGKTATVPIPGLRTGTYQLVVDGRPSAKIAAGSQGGP